MNRLMKLFCVMCLLLCMQARAHAADMQGGSRGELLYVTHCSACHNEQVHWRKEKLVTGWNSLLDQVRRWQGNVGLGWSEEEIMDTARYLNATYYRFGVNGKKSSPKKGHEPHPVRGQK